MNWWAMVQEFNLVVRTLMCQNKWWPVQAPQTKILVVTVSVLLLTLQSQHPGGLRG